jgi:hypothetical protein
MSNVGTAQAFTSRNGGGGVETSEWEDILVKKGIIEERPEIAEGRRAEADAAAEQEARDNAVHGAFEGKDPTTGNYYTRTVDELDMLADEDEDFADDGALAAYRQARMEEMKKETEKEK